MYYSKSLFFFFVESPDSIGRRFFVPGADLPIKYLYITSADAAASVSVTNLDSDNTLMDRRDFTMAASSTLALDHINLTLNANVSTEVLQ